MNAFSDKKDDFLVELTLLGDDKAFEELVIRYENRVKHTAYKVTKNTFSAEDASQDAFVCAWTKLNGLRDREKFGSWVCAIAKNRAVNIVKHYCNTSPEISYELLQNTDLLNELNGSDQAEFLRQDRDERLHEAVDALPEKIGKAVKLHYFEGLSVEETAKRLDVSLGTVKWRLSEGRRLLRKEYGVMENDKNVSFVQKVMYQVEQLKLWGLRNDKSDLETEYRRVLKNVEELDESTEKQYMLADVLTRGYWWIDKEANDEVFERIKASAEKSLNEEAMEFILSKLWEKHSGKEKIDYMENTLLPYLREKGFKKSIGYLYFWLGHALCCDSQFEKGIASYKKVLELLTKSDIYYSAALGAVYIEEKKLREGIMPYVLGSHAESLQYSGNKLYLTQRPGYKYGKTANDSFFWACGVCGGIVYDEKLKDGESFADGKNKVTRRGGGFTVETPCGKYENCVCYIFEGEHYGLTYCETYFCPNTGIVRQRSVRNGHDQDWRLSKCEIKGGSGIVPFAEGNRWEYQWVSETDIIFDVESVYEATYTENRKAILSHYTYIKELGYNESTWRGNMMKARFSYWKEDTDELIDVMPILKKAETLAVTKREKLHTAIAQNVMERMQTTNPSFNPEYTEKGYRNFFGRKDLRTLSDGRIALNDNRAYGFEWKDYTEDNGFNKILFDYFYAELSLITGTVWSDSWVPGFKENKEDGGQVKFSLEVFPEETVTVPAGEFKGCRHIRIEERRFKRWESFRNGIRDYWFAPSIGIVRFSRQYRDEPPLTAVWELTEYRGEGDGYFPAKDGLFRKYVPCGLKDGWHGWVEYTFDGDESGIVIFKNTYGTRDRDKIEAEQKQKT